jgi:hypothetical protein
VGGGMREEDDIKKEVIPRGKGDVDLKRVVEA